MAEFAEGAVRIHVRFQLEPMGILLGIYAEIAPTGLADVARRRSPDATVPDHPMLGVGLPEAIAGRFREIAKELFAFAKCAEQGFAAPDVAQCELEKAPDLDVPLALDFAKSEEDREIMELFFIQKTVARPLVAPPNVPNDRVLALRKAFIDMTKDKAFIAEAEKLALDVEPATGEDIQKIIAKIAATPQDIADKLTKAITAPK